MTDPLAAFRLDGRVALVTGSSSGIGAAVAEGLAAAGAAVVLAARRVDRCEALAERIRAAGGRALPVALDVTDEASISAAFRQAAAELGTPSVVVNNAGIADPALFLKTDLASMQRTLDTNFRGVWSTCRVAAEHMVKAGGGGSIINIASVLGLGAAPGYSAYSASKGAVIMLTRTLALEFVRHRIRVNAIAPGWFVTEMNDEFFASDAGRSYLERIPPRRTGRLEELVPPILLLASEAGSYVNGVVLPVDGGHHAALV
jgi:NAD(P)-dependent dehydrogenase (short-subunit alcohol dehydrogenase family)